MIRLRSTYGWPAGEFTLTEVLQRVCDSDSRDQIERVQQKAEHAVALLALLVDTLAHKGLLSNQDLQAILPGYEVVE